MRGLEGRNSSWNERYTPTKPEISFRRIRGSKNMNWKKLHASFVMEIESMDASIGRLDFLRRLQAWLQNSLNRWQPQLRTRYGLEEYATLDLARYPVAESLLSPMDEIRRHLAVPSRSVESFAATLSNLFWEGVTVVTSTLCTNCGGSWLRIVEDSQCQEILLACDQCAWCQTPTGEPRLGVCNARSPTKERLAAWKARAS